MNKYKYSKKYTKKKYLQKRRKQGSLPFYKKANFYKAILHVKTSFHNTIYSLTDIKGNVIFTSSSGLVGFTGRKKRNFRTLLRAMERIFSFLKNNNINQLQLFIRGISNIRQPLIENLRKADIQVTKIIDSETLPHNGCRLHKPKRL
uniref:ribosomal protein S11 n=1 Tax=Prototheca tumulicola TaxID=1737639 RepID=UPI0030022E28